MVPVSRKGILFRGVPELPIGLFPLSEVVKIGHMENSGLTIRAAKIYGIFQIQILF